MVPISPDQAPAASTKLSAARVAPDEASRRSDRLYRCAEVKQTK
jgi:hypothetical protein